MHTKGHSAHSGESIGGVHVMPVPVLVGIWVVLIVLTVVTVGVTYFDLGPFNLAVALGVALVKASLVALYYMHLRYDHPFNGFILVVSLAFVALFIGITLLDARQYQPDMIPGYAPAMQKK